MWRGHTFTASAERKIDRDVAEELSYLVIDYDTELKEPSESSDKERTYELPNGSIVTVGSEHNILEVLSQWRRNVDGYDEDEKVIHMIEISFDIVGFVMTEFMNVPYDISMIPWYRQL